MQHTAKLGSLVLLSFALIFAGACSGGSPPPPSNQAPASCQAIGQSCSAAGFAPGDWQLGTGLWRDCVNPIMQGQTSVPGATLSLPKVDPSLISQCRSDSNGKYGTGTVGSTATSTGSGSATATSTGSDSATATSTSGI